MTRRSTRLALPRPMDEAMEPTQGGARSKRKNRDQPLPPTPPRSAGQSSSRRNIFSDSSTHDMEPDYQQQSQPQEPPAPTTPSQEHWQAYNARPLPLPPMQDFELEYYTGGMVRAVPDNMENDADVDMGLALLSPTSSTLQQDANSASKKTKATSSSKRKKAANTAAEEGEQGTEETLTKESKKQKKTETVSQRKAVVAQKKAAVPQGDGIMRCPWANHPKYPLLLQYHDHEWSQPGGYQRTNRYLFEMMVLQAAQTGLSWASILQKRDSFREAHLGFDYAAITDTYDLASVNDPDAPPTLLSETVKNKLKVEASIVNARAFKDLVENLFPHQAGPDDEGGFWVYLQHFKRQPELRPKELPPFLDSMGRPTIQEYVTRSHESDRLSADLKSRGFKFVGTTIMYAYLVAVGIEVAPHSADCYKHTPSNLIQ